MNTLESRFLCRYLFLIQLSINERICVQQTANSVADSSHITAPCARKRIIAMNLPTFKSLSTVSF